MENRKKVENVNVDNEFESARNLSNDFIDLIDEERDGVGSRSNREWRVNKLFTNLSVDSVLGLQPSNDDIDIKDDFAMVSLIIINFNNKNFIKH